MRELLACKAATSIQFECLLPTCMTFLLLIQVLVTVKAGKIFIPNLT